MRRFAGHLRYVDLSGNGLKEVRGLEGCAVLQYVDLSGNPGLKAARVTAALASSPVRLAVATQRCLRSSSVSWRALRRRALCTLWPSLASGDK